MAGRLERVGQPFVLCKEKTKEKKKEKKKKNS